ncbi:MAG: aspartate aminotransferase family protein [Alphaproteobacteria bacterium]
MPYDNVASYRERAERVLPGGWLGDTMLPQAMPLVNARGKGSRIFSVDGDEYLDLACGGGALILGHAHPAVVEAVCRQAALGSHFHGLNDRAVELAEILVDAIPCAEMVRFAGSGAEATFFALRLARAATGKRKVLKFEGAYHGHHDYGMMSVTPQPESNAPMGPRPDSAGIPGVIEELVVVAPFNDAAAAVALIEQHAADLAAVIVEPVQRSFEPRPGFLEALREATRRCGVLLVFDEVVTGFRLAYGGAQQHFGVIPDLAAYGKAIAAGYPLAAVAGPAEIMKLADPARKALGTGDYAYVSGTLSGNPLCCAAAIAGLKELARPGVYERLHAMGAAFSQAFLSVFSEFDIPVRMAGVGPMFRVFFTDAETAPEDYRSQRTADQGLFVRYAEGLFRHGVFMSPRPKSYLSTMHDAADVALLQEATRQVCRAGLVAR